MTVTTGPPPRFTPGLVWRAPGDPVAHRLALPVVDRDYELTTQFGARRDRRRPASS
ncbi:hypothetical protein DSM104299_02703 [Baekduia alba]|uniref:hypothetical protein n=1 Tax=Baekduia alba TaxID=2997333 RepID=UPI002341BCC4|nr:hypothetical protein [Baekduia alba]WCB93976.1 hypothetical protein DSM104299_02703 [Baekduia alba]